MHVKSKHFVVVFFSSIIVAVVLVSTLIVYGVYIEWKEDSDAAKYDSSIYKLTADMFRKDINMSNLKAVIGSDDAFSGMPMVEGSLKNNSSKIVTSIMMEVSFSRPDGSVVCRVLFHPLGEERSSRVAREHTKNVLMPGEGISFKHLLRNCPQEVVSRLSTKSEFARVDKDKQLKVEYSIVGMSVL
jgi:hypothetical protein